MNSSQPSPDPTVPITPETLNSWSHSKKDEAILSLLQVQRELLQELAKTRRELDAQNSKTLRTSLAVIATQTWKLRARLQGYRTSQPTADLQRLFRHVEILQDTFQDLGLRLHDPVGEPFDFGLPLTVITSQPIPGATREYVLETVKPTIYWDHRLLQPGEVVIAVPEK
ncbi:MAG: hypothetical protein J0M24_19740 [Verrucomicrobia bacterium]|nr:hypothetical protein [Verrucomicrobiota bacterium]